MGVGCRGAAALSQRRARVGWLWKNASWIPSSCHWLLHPLLLLLHVTRVPPFPSARCFKMYEGPSSRDGRKIQEVAWKQKNQKLTLIGDPRKILVTGAAPFSRDPLVRLDQRNSRPKKVWFFTSFEMSCVVKRVLNNITPTIKYIMLVLNNYIQILKLENFVRILCNKIQCPHELSHRHSYIIFVFSSRFIDS